MWLVNFLVVLSATLAGCTPFGLPIEPQRPGDAGKELVTGLPWKDSLGHVPVRREIRDLKNNYPDQWSLFILGLLSFQTTEEANPTSFYQIAGIHGRPYTVWQGAEGVPGKEGTSGYCPHLNTLFFGWHRPYLALFEQELYKHVRDTALSSPPDLLERFGSAADSFRIPYWDWALGETGGPLPDFFTTPTVQVIGTNGLEQMVPNPLHHFEFHPLIPGDFDGHWARDNNTMRWPTSDLPDAVSQNDKFIKSFMQEQRGFLDSVSKGFGTAKSLNDFSLNHIESVHGWVHYTIGGASPGNQYEGHMWPVQYSAFEPLFMLHHCNVDRLFALWQAIYPDLWVESANVNSNGNTFIADNSMVDANTPLLPFWNTATTFWTTNMARDTTVLGYAYPETQSWNYSSDEAYRAAVNATISQLYSLSARSRLTTGTGESGGDLKHLNVDNSFTDWSISTYASEMELPPTFQVRFSLVGDFSSDGVTEVGAWNVLMPSDVHRTKTKRTKRASTLEPKLKGTVSLTASLLDHIAAGKLESLDDNDVVPYLTDKLTWKVYAGDGTIVPHTSLQGLTVEVVSAKVHIPNDPKQPLTYSDEMTVHPEVTYGQGHGVKG